MGSTSFMLSLDNDQIHQIKTHAQQCYPQECCGLLLGGLHPSLGDLQKTVDAVYPTDNVWDTAVSAPLAEDSHPKQTLTSARRYTIAPTDLIAAQKYARTQGWDIIGVYHSHPDQEAVPSECDRTWAWLQYSYVIVAVNQGISQDVCSWILNDQQQFQPEAMIVSAPMAASTLETDV